MADPRPLWEVLMDLLGSVSEEVAERLDELVGGPIGSMMEWMIERAEITPSTADRLVKAHLHLLASDSEYLRRSAEVVKQVCDSIWPRPRVSRERLAGWGEGRGR